MESQVSKIPPRILAKACRCQLLTGSYAGATHSCPCQRPAECKLTVAERITLADHPDVLRARKRNLIEFNEINARVLANMQF